MPKIEVVKAATFTGHTDCIYTLEHAEKNNCFYSAGGDGLIVSWDMTNPEKGDLVAKVNNSVYALHYLEDQHRLLIGENFEGIHQLDLLEKKEVQSSKITSAALFDIKSYQDKIYIASGDGFLTIVSIEDLSTIAKIKLSDKSARSLAINEVKKEVIVGFSDHTLRILDLQNFKLLGTIPAHQNSIFTVIFSPDRRYLLTGGRDAHLKIWDVEAGYELKQSIVAHMYAINHIVYSPDGNYFATCSMDKSIKIWDAKEFRLLKVIDKARHAGHGTSVNKLLWSSYNGQLISGSDDRSISVWDIEFGLN